ncbi:alpha/beta hydrolase fold family protein [Collimonas arenae]|uniref:Alpha/beta hydrolase fold family protein n=1 Tax=Collimonas arenae TaxID=279058 RepID=A0A127QIW7_9BURK|nr:alpha/beta hydrolase fold family protein [Collimonas arenae]
MERKKQPVGTERLASAWLGAAGIQTEAPCSQAVQLDMSANAALAKFTGGLSPAALSNAYVDWLLHFQLAPAEQAGLLQKAWKNLWRWSQYAIAASATVPAGAGHCIEPLPQDRRFADPAWERWPFNLIAQGFLLNQQWWHRATTGIPGVSRHHEDVVTFTARQILDMLAPSNFISTNPVVQEDALRSNGLSLVRGAQLAMADLLQLTTGHTEDETFKVGENMAVTPGKVVYHNHLIELIQYAPSTAQVHAIPLLFVPAWIMKYYILDLSPQNSLVKYLVDNGYTVFMISWKNPLTEDRDLSMEDYRKLGVMAAIDAVTSITGATQVNGVGYCLGGTLLAIAAASMARDGDQRLASLSLFAAQTDFTEPGELSLFIDEAQIGFLEAAMWEHGYLDGKQMAGAFQLLRSNDLIWSHRLNQYLRGVAENKSDLMTWNADATRMPYRMHSEYLRQLFLHNDLAEGRYRTDGKPIALTDLHIPLFAVGTLTDHVAPWRSVFKIHLLTETEVTFLLTSGGHNAGVVSPPGHLHRSYQIATRAKDGPFLDADTWQRDASRQEGSWWPAWEAWLAARSGKEVGPPAMPPSRRKAPGLYVLQP